MVTEEELAATVDKYERICEDAYKKAGEETQTFHKHWLDSPWSGFFEGKDPLKVSKKYFFRNIFSSSNHYRLRTREFTRRP